MFGGGFVAAVSDSVRGNAELVGVGVAACLTVGGFGGMSVVVVAGAELSD